MTFVKFLDRHSDPTAMHLAKFVREVSTGGLAADVKDFGDSLKAFARKEFVVVAREVSPKVYRVVDVFFIDSSGNLACKSRDMKKHARIATSVKGMLRKTHGQHLRIGMFAACVLMCWLNAEWLRLVVHTMQTAVHFGVFIGFHFLKCMLAANMPVTKPAYVDPKWDSRPFMVMLVLFAEVNVATHAVSLVCYKISGYDINMDTVSWACMGALTVAWDAVIRFNIH